MPKKKKGASKTVSKNSRKNRSSIKSNNKSKLNSKKGRGELKVGQKSSSASSSVNSSTNNSKSPPIYFIEYLVENSPVFKKTDATKFYEKVDKEWGDMENGTNLINTFRKADTKHVETKRVDSIDEVKAIAKKLKKTTFCKRKNGNGDCEDTADAIFEEIKSKPGGKYLVESHRVEYYIDEYDEEIGDYAGDPEFVQNHGYLVIFLPSKRNWLREERVRLDQHSNSNTNKSSSMSSISNRSNRSNRSQ